MECIVYVNNNSNIRENNVDKKDCNANLGLGEAELNPELCPLAWWVGVPADHVIVLGF